MTMTSKLTVLSAGSIMVACVWDNNQVRGQSRGGEKCQWSRVLGDKRLGLMTAKPTFTNHARE